MNLVFDFGAVLFTWQPARLLAAAFPERAHDNAAATSLAHTVFAHADWDHFDGGRVAEHEVVARIADRVSLDPVILADLVAHIGERLEPMAGTLALLTQLHALRSQRADLRLYYLSNMPRPYARVLEQRHAFLQWFDGGIFSGDVLVTKPNPAIYQMLESRYALEPAKTVFIDDLRANVDAAIGAGWHGIHFESPQQLKTQLQGIGLV